MASSTNGDRWRSDQVDVTAGIGALAAIVAAVVAVIALYNSGKREDRKWRREALTDTLVEFLDFSLTASRPYTFNALKAGRDISADLRAAKEAHDKQSLSLTRLRLIAPMEIVNLALKLHEADHATRRFLNLPPASITEEEFENLRYIQIRARYKLIDGARVAIGLEVEPQPMHLYTPDDEIERNG